MKKFTVLASLACLMPSALSQDNDSIWPPAPSPSGDVSKPVQNAEATGDRTECEAIKSDPID